MRRLFSAWRVLIFLCALFPIMAFAQETFTERLQKVVDGKGKVHLNQDADIANLVNGKRHVITQTAMRRMFTHMPDSLSSDTLSSVYLQTPMRKVRMTGFRVQVYAGGNSRDAKNRAYQVESQVKGLFSEHPVYTRFVSPRWICHVGDFQTREEAQELLVEMKRHFPEAIIVKCKINAYVYEEQ